MPVRTGQAIWEGSLKRGKGEMETESGALKASYTFGSRFQQKKGSNPDELIAAAHAGCFSQALALVLGEKGFEPTRIETTAKVTIKDVDGAPTITSSKLTSEAAVPEIEENTFREIASKAKEVCPVSRALGAISVEVDVKLVPESYIVS
ncbi:MAG: osmotically inducible, stress-inducible membrane protein [Promethearchaeota archaeon]|jgi:osmotically inducible protein OsmC|nr:MAG: osmotically inducible, stress-inducible membrane protein [Candidatus Lokiarchaeota archaeon]